MTHFVLFIPMSDVNFSVKDEMCFLSDTDSWSGLETVEKTWLGIKYKF